MVFTPKNISVVMLFKWKKKGRLEINQSDCSIGIDQWSKKEPNSLNIKKTLCLGHYEVHLGKIQVW